MLPLWLSGTEYAHNAGATEDTGSISGLERSPGGGNGKSLQFLSWEIPWTEKPGGLQLPGSQRWVLLSD